MLLNLPHQPQLLLLHHAEGDTLLAEAARPPDAVEVSVEVRFLPPVHGEAEVHDHRHLLHVDPWRAQKVQKTQKRGGKKKKKGCGKGSPAPGVVGRSRLSQGPTSGTDVGGNEDLLVAVTEALDDLGPLEHRQLGRQQGDVVPVVVHGGGQPVRVLTRLRESRSR